STEERAAMYGWYAPDPRMRANIGIRRRLACLLDNSRAEIELINALVLSLPGSPCLYYGDEIGMGDNIWLDDRDAVRTPMQWTPDRNAGFSTADPGKLYLPTIASLVNHFGTVNVEAQLASKSSLLHWTRAILHVRRDNPAFGLGDYVQIHADNPAILAFTRSIGPDDPSGEGPQTLLCVNNLSQHPQASTLRMAEYPLAEVTDLFGGQGFSPVSDQGELFLSLGARGFLWFQLVPRSTSR
ncbi:MAG: alpha-glucosidase C-terminal domain-containing protein, partial [Angustibacter sp.]